ncbi:hypothetical protein NIES4102_29000 [Chondrocystis sp. NIES-4102]|nr:hypothetical protein NIES4102_29000 [Chondrocystis sp. NIES-4102]
MDTLQIQINELRDKIDRLHNLIEQISNQIKELSSQKAKVREQESYSLPKFSTKINQCIAHEGQPDYQLTHKDILVDDNSSTNSTNSNTDNLAPDTQIRRLTAQLTAAYNRIAALEEQLLTYRIHS